MTADLLPRKWQGDRDRETERGREGRQRGRRGRKEGSEESAKTFCVRLRERRKRPLQTKRFYRRVVGSERWRDASLPLG